MKLGIVIPTLNEEKTLPLLLDTILAQDDLSDVAAITVADGGSTDGTRDVIKEYQKSLENLALLHNEKKLTPYALNIGYQYCLDAGCEEILFLGAHGEINRDFLKNLRKLLNEHPEISIFHTEFSLVEPKTVTEKAIQLWTKSRLGRGHKKYINIKKPLEGSQSGVFAVRRIVAETIGLYDTNFVRNQDNDYNHRAKSAGLKELTFPGIIFTYKPRSSKKAVFRQIFQYGLHISVNPLSHGWKQLAPGLFYGFILLLLTLFFIGLVFNIHTLSSFAAYSAAVLYSLYLITILIETLRNALHAPKAALQLPILFIGTHIAYAAGTYAGFLKPKKKKL